MLSFKVLLYTLIITIYCVNSLSTNWIVKSISNAKRAIASTTVFVSSVTPISTRYDPKRPTEAAAMVASFHNGALKKATETAHLTKSSSRMAFVRDAVQHVGPSVVRIDCKRELPGRIEGGQYKDAEVVRVCGSGVVVTDDGYIMTNEHVIARSKRVTVTLSNGRVYRARVVAYDELTDLAVLKADIGKETLQTATLGNSNDLKSGDWVIAVGCPVGLDFTVTLGVVSNPKRSASEVGVPHMKGAFIQTDAALNHGTCV